jgi:hypothetical protein
MLDFLAIGVHELAAISERRLERLCNPSLSGLPGFLVEDGGLHSGFMIAHCTAAALASENKVLCHPASIDSLSTSAAKVPQLFFGHCFCAFVCALFSVSCFPPPHLRQANLFPRFPFLFPVPFPQFRRTTSRWEASQHAKHSPS